MPQNKNTDTRGAGFSPEEEGHLPSGRPWFFGIGINEYQHFSKLQNACKDVRDVLQLLRERYEVYQSITLFDEAATRSAIIDQLYAFQEQLNEDDRLIIYYSGHGFLDSQGRGYWLPADAVARKASSFIRSSTLRECIEDIKARHVLLISDSCFSGALLTRNAGYAQAAMEEMERSRSRWVITSGRQREEVADGPPGGNSPFTGSILKVLRNNQDPLLNANLLFDKVTKLTRFNYRQMPQSAPLFGAGHEGGQYVFHLRGNRSQQAVSPATDTFTDPRDGKVYRTVNLNGLTWIADNLAYETGEGCWLYDDDPQNGEKYGRLYTWETAIKACPPGWRLPTDEEWKGLAMHFGGYYDWIDGKDYGNPESAYKALLNGGASGFCALLGGLRYANGNFNGLDDSGHYWTATEDSTAYAWYYSFYHNESKLYRYGSNSSMGFSCRGVRDI